MHALSSKRSRYHPATPKAMPVVRAAPMKTPAEAIAEVARTNAHKHRTTKVGHTLQHTDGDGRSIVCDTLTHTCCGLVLSKGFPGDSARAECDVIAQAVFLSYIHVPSPPHGQGSRTHAKYARATLNMSTMPLRSLGSGGGAAAKKFIVSEAPALASRSYSRQVPTLAPNNGHRSSVEHVRKPAPAACVCSRGGGG